jgi:hypothetical protein
MHWLAGTCLYKIRALALGRRGLLDCKKAVCKLGIPLSELLRVWNPLHTAFLEYLEPQHLCMGKYFIWVWSPLIHVFCIYHQAFKS